MANRLIKEWVSIKKHFSNMNGMEWFSWYVLKPFALALCIVSYIALKMGWM